MWGRRAPLFGVFNGWMSVCSYADLSSSIAATENWGRSVSISLFLHVRSTNFVSDNFFLLKSLFDKADALLGWWKTSGCVDV